MAKHILNVPGINIHLIKFEVVRNMTTFSESLFITTNSNRNSYSVKWMNSQSSWRTATMHPQICAQFKVLCQAPPIYWNQSRLLHWHIDSESTWLNWGDQSHESIETSVRPQHKANLRDLIAATRLLISNWIKSLIFQPAWLWNLMGDLKKQKGTSSILHQA